MGFKHPFIFSQTRQVEAVKNSHLSSQNKRLEAVGGPGSAPKSAAGLTEHFPVVVAIDDVTNGKPDPEGFTRAIDELNLILRPDPPLRPFETVAIEDATDGQRARPARPGCASWRFAGSAMTRPADTRT